MKLRLVLFSLALSLLAAPLKAQSSPAFEEIGRLDKSAVVLREITGAPDSRIPQNLLDRANCVAVVPTLLKGGFIFGGRYGKGVISCRSKISNTWGPPSFFTVGGGSFGLQIGGKATDLVMLIMNERGVEKLLVSKFTLGGDASAAGGPVGREAAAMTDAQMNAQILTYSRSRGLFAGVSLDGSVIKSDSNAIRRFYGKDTTARKILVLNDVIVPAGAGQFTDTLKSLSPVEKK